MILGIPVNTNKIVLPCADIIKHDPLLLGDGWSE